MFVHLHTHSYFSFLEGLPSPAALANAAAQSGMPALALTDSQGLSGAIEFYAACQEVGVQPILGLELDVGLPAGLLSLAPRPGSSLPLAQPGGALVLLAMDMAGWGGLCRLSSLLGGENTPDPGHAPRLPFRELANEANGLLCLTGGRRSLLPGLLSEGQAGTAAAYLEHLAAIFPGRLYVELQFHSLDDAAWVEPLARLAAGLGLPLVATHSIYYLEPHEAPLQRLLAAIHRNVTLAALPPTAAAPPEAYFNTPAEMEARFMDYPAALAATTEIAARCQLELPLGVPHHPDVSLPGSPPGESLDEQAVLAFLRQKAEAGARRYYGDLTPAIQSRLDHELAVIGECGYGGLFLIVEEIVAYARQRGVPMSSRGSAASSLVAHCLDITSPDPLRLDLYFERFLNPARATPPDIDTDLCSRRRDDVIRFVYQRYGAERVAMVCTINRFRRRSALREVAKAHGLSPAEISALVSGLPQRWWGPPGREEDNKPPFAGLLEQYPGIHYQQIFADATALLGMPRHLSVHPGGVVIAPGALTDLAPTLLAAKGIRITQFDLDSIERLGLVKIDLLGIRGLTVLGDVAQAIRQSRPDEFPTPLAPLESIPEDDPQTRRLVQEGRTIGCFQIESPGMRATLKEIQAHSPDDLMVALALYRPGPLTGGLKDAFVRRHRGQEAVTHLHPALAALLADTRGVILYQEQVLKIAHEFAGLSVADADLLRRAMSHFDPGKQMQTLKERFISGAFERHAVPPALAERIWEMMAAFAGYGFPKAHAASYAQVAWRAAWCKAHLPGPFMAAVLANWGGYYGQRVYLTEARRLGLALRPPLVNLAQAEFSLHYLEGQPALVMGLNQVRSLTHRTQERILRQRPFRSLADFLTRADPRLQEAENLAQAGALAGFGPVPRLLEGIKDSRLRGGQLPLFALDEPTAAGGLATAAGEDWSLAQQMSAQEAILGASVAAHPLELVGGQIAAAGAISTVEAAARTGQRVRVAGMRQTWRRSRTLRGENIYFMALEDLEGMLQVIVSAAVYQRTRSALTGAGPFIVEGPVAPDPATAEPTIHAERIERLV